VIKKVIAGLALMFGVFVAIAAFKSAEYLIQRDVIIDAKPEEVFPFLSSAKNADQWMPWRETDPKVQMTYSGPEEGLGSISSWDSPGPMGTGKAEVVGVIPNQSVKTKITYSRPMEMSQLSEFALTPAGTSTQMTWKVSGNQPFFARLVSTLMFMNMDKYVGGMFERGLNKLKMTVEGK
jgi:hypothetical protein